MRQAVQLEAITRVVRDYVEGMVRGDRARLEQAFMPDAAEVGHYEGDLLWNDRAAFIEMCVDAAGETPPEPAWEIRALHVAGDIAFVHVEDDWAGQRFDDFLTLICHDGNWRVVSKAYYMRP